MDKVGVSGLIGSSEEESKGTGRQSFTHALPIEGISDALEEAAYLHGVLS